MTNIDDRTAQLELNAALFPHYVLGRQLAMEQVLRNVVMALPPKKFAEIKKTIQAEADIGLNLIQEHGDDDDTQEHASRCGFVCALVQMGF